MTHRTRCACENKLRNPQARRRFFLAFVGHFCGDVRLGPSTLALLLQHDTLHARHGYVAQGPLQLGGEEYR